MKTTAYKVHCFSCDQSYEQVASLNAAPYCCGVCGSEEIGVYAFSPECRRCGSSLGPDKHCVDLTCPYSDRGQNDSFTEV